MPYIPRKYKIYRSKPIYWIRKSNKEDKNWLNSKIKLKTKMRRQRLQVKSQNKAKARTLKQIRI